MVVEDYQSNKSGGIAKTAEKYGIPKDYMITLWIKHYKEKGKESLGENCDMIEEIKNYIDYYNNKRIQKSLGYLTPIQFKQKQLEKQNVLQ